MMHPDCERPYGTRPVVAQLVSTLADKHKLLVHSVLRGHSAAARYARANLCHMLIEREWRPDAIDRWFGFEAGTALDGHYRWATKLVNDEERRVALEKKRGMNEQQWEDKIVYEDHLENNRNLRAKQREKKRAIEGTAVTVKPPRKYKPYRHYARPMEEPKPEPADGNGSNGVEGT